ncbi:MAG: hypothetical protein AB1503_10125 [Bacillota bacterium]
MMTAVVAVTCGVRPGAGWGAAALAALLLAVAYAGAGMLLGVVARSYLPAAFSSVMIGFISWMFGGAMVPVAHLGGLMGFASTVSRVNRVAGTFLPSTWAMTPCTREAEVAGRRCGGPA